MEGKPFNPSDEQYKKVEDLPEEEQANFTNVEGGFVRKEAKKSYDTERELVRAEFGRLENFRERIDSYLGKDETYLDEKAMQRIAANAHLSERPQNFEGLSGDELRASLQESVAKYCERIYNEYFASMVEMSNRKLNIKGYSGYLILEQWHDFDELYGVLGGKKIHINEGLSAYLDGDRLEYEVSDQLYKDLRSCAIRSGDLFIAKEYTSSAGKEINNICVNELVKRAAHATDFARDRNITDQNNRNFNILESYRRALEIQEGLDAAERVRLEETRKQKDMERKKRAEDVLKSLKD